MVGTERNRALPCWRGEIVAEPMAGGLSNESWKVTDAGGVHVARFGEDFPFHHVSRANEVMAARAAQLYDSGEDAAEASNMAKFAAADSSLKALDQAIQVHGGNGMSNEYGLADLWFVARMHKTAPVSREMVLNHIAQHSLGLPKSY